MISNKESNEMVFETSILKNFSLPYCSTCHSVQGATIKDDFTIFHANTPYTSRNFVWTALTRATDFKNVTFFEHTDKEIKRLEESKLKQYFSLKINGYKNQDLMVKRLYYTYPFFDGEKYVDYDWFTKQNKFCYHCGVNFYYELNDGVVCSNMSVDRIDSTQSHVYNNCRMSCIHCNVNKY